MMCRYLSHSSYAAIVGFVYLVCADCASETKRGEDDEKRPDSSTALDAQSSDVAIQGGRGGGSGIGAGGSTGSAGSNDSGSAGGAGKADGGPTGGKSGSGSDTGGVSGGGGHVDSGLAGSADSGYPRTSEHECLYDDECILHSDCCNCVAQPKTRSTVPWCDSNIACAVSRCDMLGVKAATCAFGRCALDVTCSHWDAKCQMLPPTCPTGELPAIDKSTRC